MDVFYTIKGLKCPNCAAKIEYDIQNLQGIVKAHINLLQQKLIVSTSLQQKEALFGQIKKIIEQYESDVELCEIGESRPLHFSAAGLTCPNCAQKIQDEIVALEGSTNCTISLQKQTITVETSETYSSILRKITAIVKKYEPDVVVRQLSEKSGERSKKNAVLKTIQVLGGILFCILVPLWYCDIGGKSVLSLLFLASYICVGFSVLEKACRTVFRGNFFDENTLMSIATLGALALGEFPEACAVMVFYQIGEYFQGRAVDKSKRSIAHLMDLRIDSVLVLRNGSECMCTPESIVPGDIVLVRAGEKIPVDGCVERGTSSLDTHALTGESLPRNVKPGDTVYSGSINCGELLIIKATHCYQDSTVAKILSMVEGAQSRKSKTEQFITRFARWYTPLVVFAALALILIPPLLGYGSFREWITRGFVFLIVSCPCALVLSIPLTFFAGIGRASKDGVLVKGSNYLEALALLDTVAFDKTGTLSKGIFSVTHVALADGIDEKTFCALVLACEEKSLHPLAGSICEKFSEYKAISSSYSISEYKEMPGLGVCAHVGGDLVLVGSESYLKSEGVRIPESDWQGTRVCVAQNGRYIGSLFLEDTLREDCTRTIEGLRRHGVRQLALLSGDSEQAVSRVAKKLHFDSYHASLLPNQKVAALENLMRGVPQGKKLAFIGDGINDAPVLARADIGIAMGGLGSDAALEAADVVLMTDEPSKLVLAVDIANATKRVATQNVVFALSVKISFLILGTMGYLGLWAAVFGDVGVTLIAVANALRLQKH